MFNEPWEEYKISDLFKITCGYVLSTNMISNIKTFKMRYPVYSSQTKENGLLGYYSDYLYENAITWTTDGANAGTVNYRKGKFYCTNVCGVLISDKVKADLMISEVLNKIAKNYVLKAGNPKLMNNVMADIKIKIPSNTKERNKISIFYTILNKEIDLYENKIILLNKYKRGLLFKIFTSFNRDNLISLKELIDKNVIEIKRGNIIPKQYGIYPVYSSSVHNNGLFCYSDNYMFDEELVSWSIDGGGNFFYRPKHKFSLTNVSGYIRVKDKNILNTQYLYYNLDYSSCNYNFDYQNKALPSYISKLYQIYLLDIKIQNKVSTILSSFDFIIKKEEQILLQLKQYKQGLLQQMFI